MKRSLVGTFLFLFVVLVVTIWAIPKRMPDYRNHASEPAGISRSQSREKPPVPIFRDVTASSGLIAAHLQSSEKLTGINEVLGAGACAFDYDNDGWTDIFVLGGSGERRHYGRDTWWQAGSNNYLFRNLGNWRFENVSEAAGLDKQLWGMGCANADLDNDGDQDLILSGYGEIRLYANNGQGTFKNLTEHSGIDSDGWSTSAAIADYDNDGLLDVYITRYLKYITGKRTFEPSAGFLTSLPEGFNPGLFDSSPNLLYRNIGGLRFQDRTEDADVADPSGKGLSAAWADLNADQYPDLLVANDSGMPNAVFLNLGDGRFREVAGQHRMGSTISTPGIAAGDVDNDGVIEFVLSTPSEHPPLLYEATSTPANPDAGPHVFEDVSRQSNLDDFQQMGTRGWGLALRDFNNDGTLDLLLANGFTVPDPDNEKTPLGQPNTLWLGTGEEFTDCSQQCFAAAPDALPSRAVVSADFDNNGTLDLLITQNNGAVQLLRNEFRGHHWLGLVLTATAGNRDAIGASVQLTAGDLRLSRSPETSGFLSSSERRLHFGLGPRDEVDELRIRWPDGTVQSIRNPPVNHYLHVTQGDADFRAGPLELPEQTAPQARTTSLIFQQPGQRLQIVRWLSEANRTTLAAQELGDLMHATDAATRRQAIQLAGELRLKDVQAGLYTALEDPDPAVRAAAVSALGHFEDEFSNRWLLRTFKDPHPEVRCAAAELYRFYFREEEAMVNSKRMAVPYLIRLLDAPESMVRSCAVDALGEAEDFRAVTPLLDLLRNELTTDLGLRIVKTLGLIRERQALQSLEDLFLEVSLPGALRQQALIACKRLGHTNLAGLIAKAFPTGDRQAAESALELFADLAQLPMDGTVIPPRMAAKAALDWFTSQPTDNPPDARTISLFLKLMGETAYTPAKSLLEQYRRFHEGTLRADAYEASLAIARTKEAREYVIAGLQDPNPRVRRAVYRQAIRRNLTIPTAAIPRESSSSGLRLREIEMLALNKDPEAHSRLMRIADADNTSTQVRLHALNLVAIRDDAGTNQEPLSGLYDSPELQSAKLRLLAKRWSRFKPMKTPPAELSDALASPEEMLVSTAIDLLAARPENWARQKLIAVLSDKKHPERIRRKVLDALSNKPTRSSTLAMRRLINRRSDPLALDAVAALPDSPDNRSFLEKVLSNDKREKSLRFAAARRLYSMGTEPLIDKLYVKRENIQRKQYGFSQSDNRHRNILSREGNALVASPRIDVLTR